MFLCILYKCKFLKCKLIIIYIEKFLIVAKLKTLGSVRAGVLQKNIKKLQDNLQFNKYFNVII